MRKGSSGEFTGVVLMTNPELVTKSFVRNILRVSLCRSRFCGRKRVPLAPKPFAIKIIEKVIEKKDASDPWES
jgi:hypothetical protein